MKKILWSLVMFFCFSAGAYKAFFYFDHREEEKEIKKNKAITRLSIDELSLIREGDFILRRGFGFFSDYVSKNLNDSGPIDVTHSGILVKEGEDWFVIHSLSSDVSEIDGMQKQPLKEFLHYSAPGKIIVTRAKGDSLCGSRIAERAQYYLDKKIPFDHKGHYDDLNELYCTELIWTILEKDLKIASPPTGEKEREKFYYSMIPMYSRDYFDIVINQYNKQ